MEFDEAVRSGLDALRNRPADVLPVFLATTAVGIVGQSVGVVAAVLVFLSLRGTGRIRRVLDRAEEVDVGGLQDATITPAEEAFFRAVGDLFTPTVLAVLLGAVAVALVAVVLVRGLTAAAKVHTARAVVAGRIADGEGDTAGGEPSSDGGEEGGEGDPGPTGGPNAFEGDSGPAGESSVLTGAPAAEDPVVAGMRGARADARTMVGFVLLQGVLLAGAPVAGGLGFVLVGGGPGALLLLLAALVWLPVLFFFYFGLLFVREAVVVDGVGLVGALGRNLSFLAEHPARALLYVAFEFALLIGAGIVANVMALLGVPRVGTLVSAVFVLPLLGLVKMGVYVEVPDRERPATGTGTPEAADEPGGAGIDAGARAGDGDDGDRPTGNPSTGNGGNGDRPTEDGDGDDHPVGNGPTGDPTGNGSTGDDWRGETGLRADLRSGFGRGWRELVAFVRARPGLVALALAVFGAGLLGGYAAIAPMGIDVTDGGGGGGGFGLFPLDVALQLAANNWLVSVSQTYAGIALGVPALVNVLFNGLLVGGLAGLGFDLRVFAALVVPHGVIEVPGLAVSGGLGLHLAGRAWEFARGNRSAEAFAGDLRRAFWVLVGLLPVFVVAGFVEAFLTPLVGEAVEAAIGAGG